MAEHEKSYFQIAREGSRLVATWRNNPPAYLDDVRPEDLTPLCLPPRRIVSRLDDLGVTVDLLFPELKDKHGTVANAFTVVCPEDFAGRLLSDVQVQIVQFYNLASDLYEPKLR